MHTYIKEVYGINTNRFNNDSATGKAELAKTLDFKLRSGQHEPNPLQTGPIPIIDKSYNTNEFATSWQKEFYNRVLNKRDTIIAVPPAAGKTGPVLNAWFKLLVDALKAGIDPKSPEFPRIMYIAKTKQLATEARIQNFIGNKDYGLFKLIADNLSLFSSQFVGTPAPINSHTPLTNNQIQEVYKVVNSMVAFITGGVPIVSATKSDIYTIKPIIISTPLENENNSIVKLLNQYSKFFCIIAIDEFQQYIPRPGDDLGYGKFNTGIEKDFDLVTGLIRNSKRSGQCGVQIMTGTVNKATIEEFGKVLNKQYNRDFKVMCDKLFDSKRYNQDGSPNKEYTANRSHVKIIAFEKMKTVQEREKLIIDIVKAKQKNSIMVVFSVKRAATTGILHMIEDLLGKLPVRFQQTTVIKSKDEDVEGNISNRYTRTNTSSAEKSLSGKELKPKETTLNSLVKTYSGNYISPNFEKNLHPEGVKTEEVADIEFLKYFNIVAAEASGESKVEFFNNKPDESNLLYQAVLRGIGIMIGKMDDRYKATIQKLFRDGKIYIILATD